MANKTEEQKFTDDVEDRIFADDSIAAGNVSKADINADDWDSDEDEKAPKIKLKNCINVDDMLANKGFVIEEDRGDPEGEESVRPHDPRLLNEYFAKDLTFGSDDEDDETDGNSDLSFDLRAQKMVDLLPDGGVRKKLKIPGLESSGSVPDQAAVTVHYSLFLEGGDEPFDSTRLRGRPERFKLGQGHVILGLDVAIMSMKKNETSVFIFSPKYAFGELGCPPRIPGKSKVFARVELIDFVSESEADALLSLSPEERNEKYKYDSISKIVAKQHIEGNRYVEQKEWKLAARTYDRSCRLLEDVDVANEEEESQQRRQLNKLYLNLGYCYIKICRPNKACSVLDKALKIDQNNVKANFRMGVAKKSLGNYPDARKYLERALRLDPVNYDVGRELAEVDRMVKTERENERALCARMFGGGAQPSLKKPAISDDTYEELVSQIDAFKINPDEQELVLPSGMTPDEILASRMIAQERGLKMVEMEKPKKKLKIVKE